MTSKAGGGDIRRVDVAPYLLVDHSNLFWSQCRGLSELDCTLVNQVEQDVEDAAAVMAVAIERSTEAVDKAHRPDRGRGEARAPDYARDDVPRPRAGGCAARH